MHAVALLALKEGARQGVFGDQHAELIDRIWPFACWLTRMVPAASTTISRSLDPESVVRSEAVSASLVVDNDGRLVGVLNTVWPNRSRSATVDLMRQPLLLDANDSMLEAIDRLRSEGRGMGIVVKAGTLTPLGVVTVKDLVNR